MTTGKGIKLELVYVSVKMDISSSTEQHKIHLQQVSRKEKRAKSWKHIQASIKRFWSFFHSLQNRQERTHNQSFH